MPLNAWPSLSRLIRSLRSQTRSSLVLDLRFSMTLFACCIADTRMLYDRRSKRQLSQHLKLLMGKRWKHSSVPSKPTGCVPWTYKCRSSPPVQWTLPLSKCWPMVSLSVPGCDMSFVYLIIFCAAWSRSSQKSARYSKKSTHLE